MYPITEEKFNKKILPIIEKYTTPLGGRPPKISHYICFNAMIYMLRVYLYLGEIALRDMVHGIQFILGLKDGAKMDFYGIYYTNLNRKK
jgi:hypothetical protein